MYSKQDDGVCNDQSSGVVASNRDRVDVLSKLNVRELYFSAEQQVQDGA